MTAMSLAFSDQTDSCARCKENDGSASYRAPRDFDPPWYFHRKIVADRILAAMLLVPCLPVILFLILLVRLTSRGPAIYRQVRVGRNGCLFSMYKIRTMVDNAESGSGPVWTQTVDPRVTPIGKIIRKLHLDEFPQLFNVLKGEMSIIGPRPERPEFVHVLSQRLPHYTGRLAVLPGITGLAQLNLPPDSDLNSVRRKLVLDLEYIRCANAWLDARLMLGTLARIFKLPVTRLLGIHRTVKISLSTQSEVAIFPENPLDRKTPDGEEGPSDHVIAEKNSHLHHKSSKNSKSVKVLTRRKPR